MKYLLACCVDELDQLLVQLQLHHINVVVTAGLRSLKIDEDATSQPWFLQVMARKDRHL